MEKESDIISFIAEYMEKGFLENIIDMFKHDKGLYALIGDLMRDDRMRVRIGMTALVEDLSKSDPEYIRHAVPGIAALLKDVNPATRGDAAYLLGIIGHCDALPFLTEVIDDEDQQVREIIWESVEEIRKADELLERVKELRRV
jgi:HEAT repeat protein